MVLDEVRDIHVCPDGARRHQHGLTIGESGRLHEGTSRVGSFLLVEICDPDSQGRPIAKEVGYQARDLVNHKEEFPDPRIGQVLDQPDDGWSAFDGPERGGVFGPRWMPPPTEFIDDDDCFFNHGARAPTSLRSVGSANKRSPTGEAAEDLDIYPTRLGRRDTTIVAGHPKPPAWERFG